MSHLQNYHITFTVIACDEDDALATLGRQIANSVTIGRLPEFTITSDDERAKNQD